jgi:hypothetical protein
MSKAHVRYRHFLSMFSINGIITTTSGSVIRLLGLLRIKSHVLYSSIMVQVSDEVLQTIKVWEFYLQSLPSHGLPK